MKPYIHAQISARRYGGIPEDYMHIHEWFDSTKSVIADVRHRAILHSAFGIYLCQQVFGATFVNSAGKTISTRDIGEQHVIDDMGEIPSMEKWFSEMPISDWMTGIEGRKNKKNVERKIKVDYLD
jgi:hypothetical protein